MAELKESNPDVGEKVTLKYLSLHMSGLPRMPTNIAPSDPNNPFAGYDHNLLVEFMKSVKLSRNPGLIHEYSNLGAGLLGDLLASQANVSYEALLKERICKPLNMNDTTISLSAAQKKRLAPPHNSALLPDYTWDFDALAGAGAIRSTTNDMIRFMQANLDPPDNSTGKALELAWQQHLSTNLFGRSAMGLGWMIAGDKSTRWHNGQTGGYHAMVLVNRDYKTGVVLLSNAAVMELDGLAQSIFQTVIGMEVKPQEFAKATKVDPEFVKRLAGKYQLAPGVVIDVVAHGDKLMVQLTGQGALRVFPENDTVWNYRVVKAQLRFEVPESGNCTKVTLHQNGRKMPAPRIEN
jgi:CubicO group peptidase (beta-lactamase class C family)